MVSDEPRSAVEIVGHGLYGSMARGLRESRFMGAKIQAPELRNREVLMYCNGDSAAVGRISSPTSDSEPRNTRNPVLGVERITGSVGIHYAGREGTESSTLEGMDSEYGGLKWANPEEQDLRFAMLGGITKMGIACGLIDGGKLSETWWSDPQNILVDPRRPWKDTSTNGMPPEREVFAVEGKISRRRAEPISVIRKHLRKRGLRCWASNESLGVVAIYFRRRKNKSEGTNLDSDAGRRGNERVVFSERQDQDLQEIRIFSTVDKAAHSVPDSGAETGGNDQILKMLAWMKCQAPAMSSDHEGATAWVSEVYLRPNIEGPRTLNFRQDIQGLGFGVVDFKLMTTEARGRPPRTPPALAAGPTAWCCARRWARCAERKAKIF
ncbi:hypothetical protein B0H16DRAFT_1482062 [Mycena metata]|uniref:Uncharacterized protein n=1 Tax=Mycena metata TaxID=1033252 RepID=A0AAD7GV45_9AGAR|nr:hypothetical protein B0H16DRAFT_1482062 [Mycena metata]